MDVAYVYDRIESIVFLHDGNGKMTSKTVNQGPDKTLSNIIWNEDNKPSSITTSTDTVTFAYDGDGDRVKQTKGANTTYYFGEAYEKRNTVGIIHLFANHQRLASIRTDGKNQYYNGNHLGSASVITDQNGNLKQKIEYYPFGTYRYGASPDQQLGAYDYDGAFPNANYTFTDQEEDDETGLYNYKARLYDPQLGRFISADSIVPEPGDLQSFNRYSYCLNNPLIYVDPSGHEEEGTGSSWIESAWDAVCDFFGNFWGGITSGTQLGNLGGDLAKGIECVAEHLSNPGAHFFVSEDHSPWSSTYNGSDNTGFAGSAFGGRFSSWNITQLAAGRGLTSDQIARYIFGETAGITPGKSSDKELADARRAIAEVALNRDDKSMTPGMWSATANPKNPIEMAVWNLCLDAAKVALDSSSRTTSAVHFNIRDASMLNATTAAHKGWGIPVEHSYGPFLNAGGGDVKAKEVYINIYNGGRGI